VAHEGSLQEQRTNRVTRTSHEQADIRRCAADTLCVPANGAIVDRGIGWYCSAAKVA
jgi:hypothetical protein